MTHYDGGYTLHLYCRNYGKGKGTEHMWDAHHARCRIFPEMYTGETFAECARVAKKDGWKIDKETRTALCPSCKKDH